MEEVLRETGVEAGCKCVCVWGGVGGGGGGEAEGGCLPVRFVYI